MLSIKFVTTFIPLVLWCADLGDILADLINGVLLLGFFYTPCLCILWIGALLLFTSLRKAGAAAAELGTPVLHRSDVFELAA